MEIEQKHETGAIKVSFLCSRSLSSRLRSTFLPIVKELRINISESLNMYIQHERCTRGQHEKLYIFPSEAIAVLITFIIAF